MKKTSGKAAASRKSGHQTKTTAKTNSLRKLPKRLRWGLFAGVIAAVLATSGWILMHRGGDQYASISSTCGGSELFIGVRGSSETESQNNGYGPVIGSVLDRFATDMKPDRVGGDHINYIAIAVNDIRTVSMYDQSYAQGVQQLTNDLYYWNHTCPNYHFVLAGYSQGADVVAQVMSSLDPGKKVEASILGKIDGAALLGDPRYNPDDKAIDAMTDAKRAGLLSVMPSNHGGKRPVYDLFLSRKLHSWCRFGDPVCQAPPACTAFKYVLTLKVQLGSSCLASIGLLVTEHLKYVSGGQTAAAGDWLANQSKIAKITTNVSAKSPISQVPKTTSPTPTATPTPAPAAKTSTPAPTTTKSTTTSNTTTNSATSKTTTPPTSTTTTPPTPAPTPSPSADRQGITSYDKMLPGAPYHGYFTTAWQNFTAQSNTITYLAATVGSPGAGAGSTVDTTISLRLCTTSSCGVVLAEAHPKITNYGTTSADIGDVAVTADSTYYIVWYQPPAIAGKTWVTYWWGGGASIGSSDQMQATVRGYNR